MAVCSGSYAVVIEAALDRLGITDAMSAWHSAEWEPLGKPHPGAYLSTAAKLGVDPTACLAFEDSFNGAISAKAARMRVVAVPEPAGPGLAPLGLLRPRARHAGGLRRCRPGTTSRVDPSRPTPSTTPGTAGRRARRRPGRRSRNGCRRLQNAGSRFGWPGPARR